MLLEGTACSEKDGWVYGVQVLMGRCCSETELGSEIPSTRPLNRGCAMSMVKTRLLVPYPCPERGLDEKAAVKQANLSRRKVKGKESA